MTTVDLGRLPRGTDGQIIVGRTGKSPGWVDPSDPLVGQGAWATYTPIVTAATGTFTTVSATGRYKQIGKTVFIYIAVTITTNGTASGSVTVTLPVTSGVTNVICGRENMATGYMLQGLISAALVGIVNYDNTYPGGDGRLLLMTGVYEAA
jgi:hypothetical protein